MTQVNSFTTSGPAPTVQNAGFYSSPATTPQAKALNSAQSGIPFAHPPVPFVAPSTAVKSTQTTDASGNSTTTTYHPPTAPDTSTGDINQNIAGIKGLIPTGNPTTGALVPPTAPSTPTPVTPTPAAPTTSNGSSTNSNAVPGQTYNQSTTGLANYGQGNNNSATVNTANAGLLGIGQNGSQAVQQAQDAIKENTLSNANDVAGVTASGAPINYELGKAGVINGVYGAQQNANQQALANALTQQGQQSTAFNEAAGSGNTQQGQNIGALGTAGSLTAPQNVPYYTNPQTGEVVGGGSVNSAIQNAGSYSAVANSTQKYIQGNQNIAAADNIQKQIVSTLANNPTLNSTPITALTNLNEFLSGQASDPSQQLLSQQVASYISTLGLDPATVTNIASQQKGTLAQLLDSLRATAVSINEGNNPSNIKTGNTSSSGGDMFGSFFSS